ncbi:MAG: hypothetical protein R2834_22565 [Rhodothermales bacterium]
MPGGGTLTRAQNWHLVMTRIRVVDAQEDKSLLGIPLSDGDEPYFVMFGFRSRFGRTGSTQIDLNDYDNSDWGGGLRTGQQANIPTGMGQLRFDAVQADEVIGFVAVAFESDRTPWAVMRNRVNEVKEIVKANVARSVEERRKPELETTAFIDELHLSLQEAVVPLSRPLTTGQAVERKCRVFRGRHRRAGRYGVGRPFMRTAPTGAVVLPHYRNGRLTDRLTSRTFDRPPARSFLKTPRRPVRCQVSVQEN